MEFRWDDTIAALASPPGPGWRGIVRLSGPTVTEVLDFRGGLFVRLREAPDPPNRQSA